MFEQLALRPRLHRVKDFHYPLRISTKKTTMVYTRAGATTPTFNPLHKKYHKFNEVYKLLVTTKIANLLFTKYRMRNEAQEVCVRENSVEMNELESLKLVEIDLKLKALET